MYKYVNKLNSKIKLGRPLNVVIDSGAKHSPTIIFLQGITASPNIWSGLIEIIGSEKYRIIAFDLLGFGKSPKPTRCQYSVEDHVRSIRTTIKKLNIRKPYILVGHSMGAIIAARYCKRHQKEIKNIYLLSLPIYLKDDKNPSSISRTRTDFYLEFYKVIMGVKEFSIKSCSLLSKLFRIADYISINEDNWDAFRLSLKNTIINQDVIGDIKKIKVPIYIFYGLLDEFLVPEYDRKLAELSNVKVTKIIGADHSISKYYSKEVAKQIVGHTF